MADDKRKELESKEEIVIPEVDALDMDGDLAPVSEPEINPATTESIPPAAPKKRGRPSNKEKAMNTADFSKSSAYMESGQEQFDMYAEDVAISYFDEEEAMGDKAEIRDDIIRLLSSVRANDILEGVVTGFLDSHKLLGPSFTVAFGHRKVRVWIPIKHFIADFDESRYMNKDGRTYSTIGLQWLRSVMQSYVGAKIKFVCIKLFEKEQVAYASRLQAMDRVGHYYYQKPNMRTRKPPVEEGKPVTGTIISVMQDRVIYDVCGTDVMVRGRDLDWLAKYDLTKEKETYYIGARHRLRITEIGDETKKTVGQRTYRIQHVKASRKLELPNPNEEAYKRGDYFVGQTVGATIKSVNQNLGIYVNLEDRVVCLCDNAPGNPPLESTCLVVITDIYPDYQIRGKILPTSIVPPRNNYTF